MIIDSKDANLEHGDMPEPSTSAMIALLPTTTDWCHIELPHLTLVYAGKTDDLSPTAFNELAKAGSSLGQITGPVLLQTTGVDKFGGDSNPDNPEVDVITFAPTGQLMAMRTFVEEWNQSSYPFTPHCTVGPVGSIEQPIPTQILFDRVCVAWNREHLIFSLT